ncbi:MAG: hypothetical protein QOD75_638 [Blastocatellia bacterium]|nr:hypothetical protein [Blastocatellia bacterium]
MSELKLNLIDAQTILCGEIHGSVVDAAVAALSAEPETIPELAAALARYIKPVDDTGPFQWFRSATEIDAERYDAGIVIIDLAGRIVAVESSYSQPQHEGVIDYHDGTQATDVEVMYRLPDDWLFVNSVEAYLWSHDRRRKERIGSAPLDVRAVLYGAPLLEFLVNESAKIEVPEDEATAGIDNDNISSALAGIHEQWLFTPREDLRGQSPRELLLAKQDFIDFDLHTRSLQWSLQGEGPPCLGPDAFAYRFAGFGTHEWVIYYDLIRHLLSALWSSLIFQRSGPGDSTPSAKNLILQLEEIKTNWLEQPQSDYDGRIPAVLIENERKRLPIALRPRDMIIDEDCPMCQMFGDETSPLGMGVGFWFLDGCNMDDDFVFSSYKTIEEWEAENHRRDEFNKEFMREREERQQRIARGELVEPNPYFDPEPFDMELDEAPPV